MLATLGADVTAVDKAPLAAAVAAMPGVTERLDSAFGMAPEPVDWLFSDVIAYPDRLLALVRRWIDAGAARLHRLHHQVPGADRPRRRRGLRRHPRRPGRPPVPQQARADLSSWGAC